MDRNDIFIRTAINPYTPSFALWNLLMRLVALYEFIAVPVRIGFEPWPSMLAPEALSTDLLADCFVMTHMIVNLNTAYRNSRSQWVTSRRKIFRKADVTCMFAAFPLDWFAYICGASEHLCSWLRINKMFLVFSRVFDTYDRTFAINTKCTSELLCKVARIILATCHVLSCVWFFIGENYRHWFPHAAISWYYVDPAYQNMTFVRQNFYGMSPDSSTWQRYVISFYWVCATLSMNGMIGDLIPQNIIEIVFTIVLMCLNLTLFRILVGEVSTIVMKEDQDVVKRRENLETISSFLSNEKFTPQLKEEIQHHFRTMEIGVSQDQAVLLRDLNHNLRVEVAKHLYKEYIETIPLFDGCSQNLLDGTCILLHEMHYYPEENLFNFSEGEPLRTRCSLILLTFPLSLHGDVLCCLGGGGGDRPAGGWHRAGSVPPTSLSVCRRSTILLRHPPLPQRQSLP